MNVTGMDPEIYDKFFIEIQLVLRRNHAGAVGLEGPELLAYRRKEVDTLLDIIGQQKRALAYAAGEPVEPMVQFGSGVLIGKVSG